MEYLASRQLPCPFLFNDNRDHATVLSTDGIEVISTTVNATIADGFIHCGAFWPNGLLNEVLSWSDGTFEIRAVLVPKQPALLASFTSRQ